LCDEIEKQTGGDLSMHVHVGGSLPIKVENITQAVSDGVIPVADDGYFSGNIPIGGVLRLPMLITSESDFETAQKVMLPYLERAYAGKGCLVLGTYHFPQQIIWGRDKIVSLADLSGRKMRVTSPEQGEFVRRFGGTPVTIGGSDVPSALDRGIVDGVFTGSSGGGSLWHNQLKYCYRLGPNYFDGYVIANKAAFTGLPAVQQALLRKSFGAAGPTITKAFIAEDEGLLKQFAAQGMVVTKALPSDEKLGADRMSSYWDDWARDKGPDAQEGLKKVRAAIHR
jgi:TRAP-type C4-dicarboxylate transport system substrate-binding protein